MSINIQEVRSPNRILFAWLTIGALGVAAIAAGSRYFTPAVLALVGGIAVGNSPLRTRFDFAPVTTFLTKRVLRVAVVGLGAGIDLGMLAGLGATAISGAIIGVLVAMWISAQIGKRLGLSWRAATLIGVGTAICGASAIVAVAPVLEATEEEVGLSLGVIFTFNGIALILLPAIALYLGLSDLLAGIWAGLGVHDTAAAVAAGFAVSPEAGEIATVVKLSRTLLLIPVVLVVSALASRARSTPAEVKKLTSVVPLFVVGFVIASVANSLGFLGQAGEFMSELARAAVVFVVAGVGVTLNRERLALGERALVKTGFATSAVVAATALVTAILST